MNDRFFQAYMTASTNAMFVCDKDGIILQANAAANRLYGPQLGRALAELVAPGSRDSFEECRQTALAGVLVQDHPLETYLAAGTPAITHTSFTAVGDDDSPKIICVLKDAREYRKFFSHMVQAEKMASIGRLAGGIAHQLNTPLGSILLTAQLLGDSLHEPEQLADLDKIIRQVKVCKDTINHFLRISRPGEADPQEILSLPEQIKEVIALFEKPLREKNITIALQLDCKDSRIQGNRTLLNQLFINLISNALDVMPQGGCLKITSVCLNEKVRLFIHDEGPGISDADRGNIFDPFFTTKPVGEGTGLGLYIAHRVAQEHGGSLELAETGGSGSVFVLTLPQACAFEPAVRRS